MRYKIQPYCWSIICLSFLFIGLSSSQAQTKFDIVLDGDFKEISRFYWSYDNQRFTFLKYRYDNAGSHPIWREFNLETQVLSQESKSWSLQAPITTSNDPVYQARDFALASPNNHLVAIGSDGMDQVLIVNRQSLEFLETDIYLANPDFIYGQRQYAFWSANSKAFVYNRGAEFISSPLVYYIYIPDTEDFSTASITMSHDISINNIDYSMGGQIETSDVLYAISPDGQKVLLSLRRDNADILFYPQYPELVVWSPNDPSQSIFVEAFDVGLICNASFAPDSNTEIIVLLLDGQMFLYNIETKSIQRLPIQVDDVSTCRDNASPIMTEFSHNGAWLFYQNLWADQLAFLDIAHLIETAPATPYQAPIAIANPDMIIYDDDNDGIANVSLDATASYDPDGTIVETIWRQGEITLNLPEDNMMRLELGMNRLVLVVRDNDNLTGQDELFIDVRPPVED